MHSEVPFAAQGKWKVFPLVHRSCFAVEQPLLADATSSTEQIEQWRKQYPDCNWAVATGRHSDVFALELSLDLGVQMMRARCGEEPGFAATLQMRDANRIVVFFRWPDDDFPPCGCNLIAPGIRIRQTGSYVAIPATNKREGKGYEYGDPEASVLAAPSRLIDFVRTALIKQKPAAITSFPLHTASMRSILLIFTRKCAHWICEFYATDDRRKIGKTLSFRSSERLVTLVERGGAVMDEKGRGALYGGIERGEGSILLNLTRDQYEKLIAA